MFRHILVPLDGSPFAESAIPAAVFLADKEGGGLHLVHVFDPLEESTDKATYREAARGYLSRLAKELREEENLPVSSSVREGDAETEIMAEAAKADLVVMATHGRGAVSRFWLGSVADACIRACETPLLLVRPPDPDTVEAEPIRAFAVSSVVVALDGSPLSESALPVGEHLARAFHVPMHLVQSVCFPVGFASNYVMLEASPAAITQKFEWASQYMYQKVGEIEGRGIEPTVHLVATEAPPQAILDVAGQGGLIVIATHGTGGIGRALVGSVTDKVVRGARGPVLVLRPPKQQQLTREAPKSARRPRARSAAAH